MVSKSRAAYPEKVEASREFRHRQADITTKPGNIFLPHQSSHIIQQLNVFYRFPQHYIYDPAAGKYGWKDPYQRSGVLQPHNTREF